MPGLQAPLRGLGREDSSSGIRAQAMHLKCRNNSRWLGQSWPPETIRYVHRLIFMSGFGWSQCEVMKGNRRRR
jgi:hypothetical protein